MFIFTMSAIKYIGTIWNLKYPLPIVLHIIYENGYTILMNCLWYINCMSKRVVSTLAGTFLSMWSSNRVSSNALVGSTQHEYKSGYQHISLFVFFCRTGSLLDVTWLECWIPPQEELVEGNKKKILSNSLFISSIPGVIEEVPWIVIYPIHLPLTLTVDWRTEVFLPCGNVQLLWLLNYMGTSYSFLFLFQLLHLVTLTSEPLMALYTPSMVMVNSGWWRLHQSASWAKVQTSNYKDVWNNHHMDFVRFNVTELPISIHIFDFKNFIISILCCRGQAIMLVIDQTDFTFLCHVL